MDIYLNILYHINKNNYKLSIIIRIDYFIIFIISKFYLFYLSFKLKQLDLYLKEHLMLN